MSHLFTPLNLGHLTLENRIIVAPMCQYSAENGRASDWHTIHLGSMATSGAGLLFLEDTAVNARGSITSGDLGLWDDATEAALADVLTTVRKYSSMPIGIQLGHAGRKVSTSLQWLGGVVIAPDAPDGWQTIAPSPLPFFDDAPVPDAASAADIAAIIDDFASAARCAERSGLDVIELQGAHGYLLHQFLSPLSNQRSDEYGGSLANRMRPLLDVFDAVRAVFPAHKPLGVRISATDWVEGGWDVNQSIVLARELERRGSAFIHVSSSGLSALQKIPVAPGFQVPLAAAIKRAVGIPVIAVGMIISAAQAEAVLAEGNADAVALARGFLRDPHWAWRTAAWRGARAGRVGAAVIHGGGQCLIPRKHKQYARQPSSWVARTRPPCISSTRHRIITTRSNTMSNAATFTTYTIDNAPAASKPTLESVKKAFSFVPNLQANMAESPELLAGYSALWDLFSKSTLTPHEQQVVYSPSIALTYAYVATASGSSALLYSANGEMRTPMRRAGTGPNPRDVRTRHAFIPDANQATADRRGHFDEGRHAVGLWHTHPEANPVPSTRDHATACEFLKDFGGSMNGFLLIIIGNQGSPLNMAVWLASSKSRDAWVRLIER